MDLVFYFIFALVCIVGTREKDSVEVLDRETKLNPEFYRDGDAFMKYVHELIDI